MIENFNNIYLLVLHLLVTGLFGVFSYRALLAPHGMVKEFNMDESSIYIICLLYTSPSPRDVEESRVACCG